MEKQLVIIGLLGVVGAVTIIFGKVIGPKLLDWIGPRFNKVTDKLDDAIMGKPDEWETKVREIVETKPEHLKQRAADIISRFAKPTPFGSKPSSLALPSSARNFFEKYCQLAFDGQTKILDASALRTVADKKRQYLLVGRSEDDGHFYAIDLQDNASVVRLEVADNGKVFHVEEDAPSLEHFVILQHELHLRNT